MNKKAIILTSICVLFIILIIILSFIKPSEKIEVNRVTDPKEFFTINYAVNLENEDDDNDYSFVTTDIYYVTNDNITTYFVTGFAISGVIEQTYRDNVNYLLKKDGIAYQVTPLNNITSIKEYANNYKEEQKEIKSNKIMPTYNYNEANKLFYYITVYNYLVTYNPSKASVYSKSTIKQLSTDAKDYTVKTENNQTIYTITKSNVKVYENSIMDFKLEY